jgi:hypothetical protein
MDSSYDSACLEARIRELEREVMTLRENCSNLVKEKEEIFYKWTKTDFMDMLDMYCEDIEGFPAISDEAKEKLWTVWKEEFDKRWSSSDCHGSMMNILCDLASENRHILFPSPTGK